MLRTIVPIALAALLPAAGAPADPAASVFPPGWRQGWARSVEGRRLSYRWGYPGLAVSLLSRAVDATRAIAWEGEAAPPLAPSTPRAGSRTAPGPRRAGTARVSTS